MDGVVGKKFSVLLRQLSGKRLIVGDDKSRLPYLAMTLTIVKVFPKPVTPSRVWYRRFCFNPDTRLSMAFG